jgi:hypothetical protein
LQAPVLRQTASTLAVLIQSASRLRCDTRVATFAGLDASHSSSVDQVIVDKRDRLVSAFDLHSIL